MARTASLSAQPPISESGPYKDTRPKHDSPCKSPLTTETHRVGMPACMADCTSNLVSLHTPVWLCMQRVGVDIPADARQHIEHRFVRPFQGAARHAVCHLSAYRLRPAPHRATPGLTVSNTRCTILVGVHLPSGSFCLSVVEYMGCYVFGHCPPSWLWLRCGALGRRRCIVRQAPIES